MKQIYFLLAVLYNTVLLSQTVLTSYPLSLQKNAKNNQILTAQNEKTHELFVFVSTKENLTVLRYNSALFLIDQFNSSPKYTEDRTLIGYSFSEDGNPTLYWSSAYGDNIIIIKYYFEDKTSKALKFQFPNATQIIRSEYQNDNSFVLFTEHTKEPKIILYVFKNGNAEAKELDFSSFAFQDKSTKPKTFNQILREYPIEKMETDAYNPLYKACSKSKMYALKDRIILTFDQNPRKTQLFDINLNTLDIKEKNFTQPVTKKASKSTNSFYHENKLYQISTNEEELLFDIKDFDTEQLVKSINVAKQDTIRFKNSPFLIQKDDNKPRELKNTAKFLNQLADSDIGISVFKNKKNLFITLGGTREESTSNYTDMFNDFPVYENSHSQSVFFESIWDKKLGTTTAEQQPLGIDKIYSFVDDHKEIALESILKFKDYYILGYFDTTTKQYTMRKFTDGYN